VCSSGTALDADDIVIRVRSELAFAGIEQDKLVPPRVPDHDRFSDFYIEWA
jgi:hypothetical protein